MGSRGWGSGSGGGGMPVQGGRTETDPPSGGASLLCLTVWETSGEPVGHKPTTCCQVTLGYLQPKHIFTPVVRREINI